MSDPILSNFRMRNQWLVQMMVINLTEILPKNILLKNMTANKIISTLKLRSHQASMKTPF